MLGKTRLTRQIGVVRTEAGLWVSKEVDLPARETRQARL